MFASGMLATSNTALEDFLCTNMTSKRYLPRKHPMKQASLHRPYPCTKYVHAQATSLSAAYGLHHNINMCNATSCSKSTFCASMAHARLHRNPFIGNDVLWPNVIQNTPSLRCDQNFVVFYSPAGKGVSSSAALEVSIMSAVAAAHDVELHERELALLCQKAEASFCCCYLGPP